MIGYDELAEICRHADALAEEHGDIPHLFAGRDIDMEGLTEAAIQRGLRAAMIACGRRPPSVIERQVVVLPEPFRSMVPAFAAAFVDGFNAGYVTKEKQDAEAEA